MKRNMSLAEFARDALGVELTPWQMSVVSRMQEAQMVCTTHKWIYERTVRSAYVNNVTRTIVLRCLMCGTQKEITSRYMDET